MYRRSKYAESPVPWWADGVHLGMLVLAVVHLTYALNDIALRETRSAWVWIAVSVALVVALTRGRRWAAVPLALAVPFVVGRGMLFGAEGRSWFGDATVYHSWVSLAPYGLMAAGAVVLAVRGRHGPGVRSWWWSAVPVAMVVANVLFGVELYSDLGSLVRAAIEGALLLAAIWMTAVTGSARWALAAASYVLPGVLSTLLNMPNSTVVAAYWLVLTGLLLALAGTAVRRRPRTTAAL